MAAWAVLNVNRKKNAKAIPVGDLMFYKMGREGTGPARSARKTSDAAPVMRYALPGERPPSKYAPGTKDPVFDRFDAYMKARQGSNPWQTLAS